MSQSIRNRFLSDEEAERLYRLYPSLGRSPSKYCPTCNKKGTYFWDGKEHECDCEYQLQLHKHYLAAGVGVTYQRLDWTDFEGSDEVIKGAFKYLGNHEEYARRGMGLYLTGQPGTGKTLVANLMIKEMIKHGYTCYATTFAQTVEAFTAGWRDKSEKDYFQRKFLRSEVLLLDDFGRELRGTKLALAESTFDAILRQRVQEGRVTFLTTNLDDVEVEDGYGAAILSLLREKSIQASLAGDDFRPKANRREMWEVDNKLTRPIV